MQNALIHTNRTYLELIIKTDLDWIHELLSIPEVDRFNTLGIPANQSETMAIIEPSIAANQTSKSFTLGVKKRTDDMPIGLVGIIPNKPKYQSAEVYFKYFPHSWNQGYGTEVLNGLIDYCFDTLNLQRVEAGCAVENFASKKVMEKVGMTQEGRRRKTLPLANGWSDHFDYAILNTDPRFK